MVTRYRTSTPYVAAAFLTVIVPLCASVGGAVLAVQRGVSHVEIAAFLLMYTACAVGTETGFHRLLSHRAFRAKAPLRAALCILGCMAAQGPPLFWIPLHRQHHARTDREGDPHSPYPHGHRVQRPSLAGFAHAHVGWLFGDPWQLQPKMGDLASDRMLIRLNRLYPLWVVLGILAPALGGFLWTGSLEMAARAALWGGLIRIAALQQVTWCVNSFGHLYGARPFDRSDGSTNNLWLVPFTFGGAWHNNHHAFPSSARVGLLPWQLDLHYWLIRVFAWVGLASHVKVPVESKIRKSLSATREQDESIQPSR